MMSGWLFRTVWQDYGWFEAQPAMLMDLLNHAVLSDCFRISLSFFQPTSSVSSLSQHIGSQHFLLSGTYCRQLYRLCRRRGGESIFLDILP